MATRQMKLWDIKRWEADEKFGKRVWLVWVAYTGVIINRECFIAIRKDRNGKQKVNES